MNSLRRVIPQKEIVYAQLRRVAIAVCSACIIATRSYGQFEGIVESKNTTMDEWGKPQQFLMTMWIKKDMVRIETSSASMPGSTMLYRTDQKKIFMLNLDDKSYFEISQDEKPQEVFGAAGTTLKFTTRRTGKTKAILGYSCEQFVIKRDREETVVWGTKKLAHLVDAISKALGQEHANSAEGATQEVMKKGFFPMQSSTKIEGVVVESQEVTKVEARTLDAKVFELPPDFKKQKSVEMMQGAQDAK